jgi:pyruvate/2-oxoglutarate dehydrogenase complex dihydrolipoamide dehydrogenase (E3) component
MKIAVNVENEEILGAAVLGTGGDETIHCVLDVMYAKAPLHRPPGRCTSIRPCRSLIPTILGEFKPL